MAEVSRLPGRGSRDGRSGPTSTARRTTGCCVARVASPTTWIRVTACTWRSVAVRSRTPRSSRSTLRRRSARRGRGHPRRLGGGQAQRPAQRAAPGARRAVARSSTRWPPTSPCSRGTRWSASRRSAGRGRGRRRPDRHRLRPAPARVRRRVSDGSARAGPASAHAGSNLLAQEPHGAGDPEAKLAESDVVVQERFTINRVSGLPMETRAIVAEWQPGAGELTVRHSTQTPHLVRKQLAESLRLDDGAVRVVASDVGGAFGLKIGIYPEDVLACLHAMRARRPVKWVEDRVEFFRATTHARESVTPSGSERAWTARSSR